MKTPALEHPRGDADAPGDAGAYLATRRRVLGAAGCCIAAAAGSLFSGGAAAVPWASGCGTGPLPPAAAGIVAEAFEGVPVAGLWDAHCHLLGNGDSGSGCWLHPSLTSGFDLVERLRRRVILDAACVPPDAASVDQVYVERLLRMAAAFPAGARWLLLAFEAAHDDAGRLDRAHTTVHVPDRYAGGLAERHAGVFEWAASIHPYREDAEAALVQAHARGARAVKWLPSAMNIDLMDRRSRRFAARSAALGLPLIVHCGEEKAVPGARRDALVNPLHVRAPLEEGATVVVAHAASLGHAPDLDRPSRPVVPAFDLFARLMGERAHGMRLLADVSAVFQVNRRPEVWQAVLEREDWHPRLLHGSDYPLPGLRPLVSLRRLASAGLLPPADLEPLGALRAHNVLLFDFVLKRRLASRGARLAPVVFDTRRVLARTAPASGRVG